MSGIDPITTTETAARLGVSRQQVNRLAERGEITRVARGLFDRLSVERLGTARQGATTRAWAEATAWGAVALLCGERPDWLGATQTSRLRAALRGLSAAALVARSRNRAKVVVYAGHRSVAARLRSDLVVVDTVALGLVSTEDSRVVDGYLSDARVEAVVAGHGLQRDDAGSVTLRSTGFDLAVVEHLVAAPDVVAALDAATSLDARARGVGSRVLTETLDRYR